MELFIFMLLITLNVRDILHFHFRFHSGYICKPRHFQKVREILPSPWVKGLMNESLAFTKILIVVWLIHTKQAHKIQSKGNIQLLWKISFFNISLDWVWLVWWQTPFVTWPVSNNLMLKFLVTPTWGGRNFRSSSVRFCDSVMICLRFINGFYPILGVVGLSPALGSSLEHSPRSQGPLEQA